MDLEYLIVYTIQIPQLAIVLYDKGQMFPGFKPDQLIPATLQDEAPNAVWLPYEPSAPDGRIRDNDDQGWRLVWQVYVGGCLQAVVGYRWQAAHRRLIPDIIQPTPPIARYPMWFSISSPYIGRLEGIRVWFISVPTTRIEALVIPLTREVLNMSKCICDW